MGKCAFQLCALVRLIIHVRLLGTHHISSYFAFISRSPISAGDHGESNFSLVNKVIEKLISSLFPKYADCCNTFWLSEIGHLVKTSVHGWRNYIVACLLNLFLNVLLYLVFDRNCLHMPMLENSRRDFELKNYQRPELFREVYSHKLTQLIVGWNNRLPKAAIVMCLATISISYLLLNVMFYRYE